MSAQTAQTAAVVLQVIEPKIALPRVGPGMLRSSRLLEMIEGGAGAALSVVDAPVGSARQLCCGRGVSSARRPSFG